QVAVALVGRRRGRTAGEGLEPGRSLEVLEHGAQGRAGKDRQAARQGRLGGVGRRDEELADPPRGEEPGQDEDAVHVADGAVQRELAQEGGPPRRRSPRVGKADAYSDGEVETGAIFAKAGRGEVDRQPPRGELAP